MEITGLQYHFDESLLCVALRRGVMGGWDGVHDAPGQQSDRLLAAQIQWEVRTAVRDQPWW